MTTENKAIDDLLRPRYKVIADYPLSVHAIGEVLVPYIGSTNMCVVEGGFFVSDLSKYPHLFKKLEWWEERQISEMPEYVRRISDNKIEKVLEWTHRDFVYEKASSNPIILPNVTVSMSVINCYAPATEADYQKQQGHE